MSKDLVTVTQTPLMTLPSFSKPDTLESAALTIDKLGKNLHEHAYIVGKTLSWVKREVGHGNFEVWTKENVWFSISTAQHFMQYARECDSRQFLLEYHGKSALKNGTVPLLDWLRVTNHWFFTSRDDTLGIEYPGNIPGQIALNVIYYYTNEGDLVVDPMAGGGSTIDACNRLNRRCLAYDINLVREDVKCNDITKGFPDEAKNCDLIFLDPPYYKIMRDKYVEASVSSLDLPGFLDFLDELAAYCYQTIKNRGFVSFLCQNYYHKFASLENGYTNFGIEGYKKFTDKGFNLVNLINCPQTSQVYSASDVELAKKQRGMLNLVRDLFIFQKG